MKQGIPMIKNKEAYDVVYQQIQRVQSALESLRREVEPKNKRNFEILTEGYDELIAELTRELESYQTEALTPDEPLFSFAD